MKVFAISILLFIILLAVILSNALYIRSTAQIMHQLTARLDEPKSRSDVLDELRSLWEKRRPIIALTVGYRELDHFDETLTQLQWAHQIESEAEFAHFRALLPNAIDELTRTEHFSIKNIF